MKQINFDKIGLTN